MLIWLSKVSDRGRENVREELVLCTDRTDTGERF